ncbi:MAG: hypothetical protein ACFFFC_20095 [Candidatus Thorarchaeota archaeon]
MDVYYVLNRRDQYPTVVVEQARQIRILLDRLHTYLRADITDFWMKPEDMTVLFQRVGRPTYTNETAHRLVEDILSLKGFQQTTSLGNLADDQMQHFGERLATISDAELCCVWFMTVGKLGTEEMPSAKYWKNWLKKGYISTYKSVCSGSKSRRGRTAEFDLANIMKLREKKKELTSGLANNLRRKCEKPRGDRTLFREISEEFADFLELSTACAIWERLCNDELVEERYRDLNQGLIGWRLRNGHSRKYRRGSVGRLQAYLLYLQASIADYNTTVLHSGKDVWDIVLDYMSIESLILYQDALGIAWHW